MLEGLPSDILKTIPSPCGLAPHEIDAMFRTNFEVVPMNHVRLCRCGCGREVNVGDIYAGEFCKERTP